MFIELRSSAMVEEPSDLRVTLALGGLVWMRWARLVGIFTGITRAFGRLDWMRAVPRFRSVVTSGFLPFHHDLPAHFTICPASFRAVDRR
jgi:hypothetical protein